MKDTNKEIDWEEIWNKERPVPTKDKGDIFTLNKFIEYVNDGLFIDWDGSGYYSDGVMYSHKNEAYPSEIKKGNIDYNFTHVVWFNK